MYFLGIDTSNYTTSVAIFDSNNYSYTQKKKLLSVPAGERGLRQSEAVFQHTVALPELVNSLFSEDRKRISAVGVSVSPRREINSYMPCFLVGKNVASCIAAAENIPLFETSHQHGHILSALISCGRLDLINERFIAFHLSGGTTEALLVEPDKDEIIKVSLIAGSLDLKFGQLIDRTGVLLGLKFPCGPEIDKLSMQSNVSYNIRPTFRGLDCCVSGIENQILHMKDSGASKEDIARFCIENVVASIEIMTEKILAEYGNLPLVFAGGVSSNSLLRKIIRDRFNAFFAEPELSADNAVGVSAFAAMKYI